MNAIEQILNEFYEKKAMLDDEEVAEVTEVPVSQVSPPQANIIQNDLFYHIILDHDFPYREKLGDASFKGKFTGHIRDFIKESNYLPILYSLDDAKRVSEKLITWVMDKGTTKGKRMPIFGAVILGFRLSPETSVRQIDENIEQHGGKDYSLIFANKKRVLPVQSFANSESTKEMITYFVKGKKRGLISSSAIQNATLISASYGDVFNYSNLANQNGFSSNQTPLHMGLLMLNMLPHFTEDDIRLLRQVLAKNGKEHMLSTSSTRAKKELHDVPMTPITQADQSDQANHVNHVDTETSVYEPSVTSEKSLTEQQELKGGDYKRRYKLEKQKYMELKKMAKSKGLI